MHSTHYDRSARVLFLPVILSCAMVIILHAAKAHPAVTAETVAENSAISIHTLNISGLLRSKEDTIGRLLPRPIPSEFTRAEVEEFERRIRNLSLFDRVQVTTHEGNLAVYVYETGDNVIVKTAIPGVKVEDIEVSVGQATP